MLLALAIVGTMFSAGLTVLVFFANMMSDAIMPPSEGWQGSGWLVGSWLVTACLYAGWWWL